MDKIAGVSNSIPLPSSSSSSRADKPKSTLFQQNLDAAQAKRQALETPPSDVAPLSEVRSPIFPSIPGTSAEVVDKTQKLIDLLDAYAKDMEDPQKTLKDMEPLIASIHKKASQLVEEADKLPQDPELQKIARACAVTANVAYIKFYRGDYA